jgi:hypothetical protein
MYLSLIFIVSSIDDFFKFKNEMKKNQLMTATKKCNRIFTKSQNEIMTIIVLSQLRAYKDSKINIK